jgi:RimJ/RimL family protein N-acetyltransferase
MPRLEVFKKHHLDQIDLGYNMPEEVKESFMRNGNPKGLTLFDNDLILGLGGIHPLWAGVGECWIMLSTYGRKKPLTVAKHSYLLFDDIMEGENLNRMQASVAVSDSKALSFAKWLGFEVEGLMRKYGPDGEDYYRLARIR